MRSLLGMEGKLVHFLLLPALNFLFILMDTFVLPCFVPTVIQMSKRFKTECNAINTTKNIKN